MGHKFERYCKEYENIENYQKALADNFVGWDCHHRLETWNSDGERRLVDITPAELKALGMYYNIPASELIFLTVNEHRTLHKVSEDTKKKLSEANKGENNSMFGKHHTEDTKKKISEANKGKKLSEETRKKLSEAAKNMSEETKNKIGASSIGRHWYNNGKENKFCYECPPGFVPGILK